MKLFNVVLGCDLIRTPTIAYLKWAFENDLNEMHISRARVVNEHGITFWVAGGSIGGVDVYSCIESYY